MKNQKSKPAYGVLVPAVAAIAFGAVSESRLRALVGATRQDADAYYVVVYGAQAPGNHPETSHCFATFARVAYEHGDSVRPRVELHHINWFSVRGHKTGMAYGLAEPGGRITRPEPGENRTTREALELAHRGGLRVTRWGPYEVSRGLYERALRQIDRLEGRIPGRRVLYKTLDMGCREGDQVEAVNCIHAVSDVVRGSSPLRTWASYGNDAACKIVTHLRPWLKRPLVARSDVWDAMWAATWEAAEPPATLEIHEGAPPDDGTPALDRSAIAFSSGPGRRSRASGGR